MPEQGVCFWIKKIDVGETGGGRIYWRGGVILTLSTLNGIGIHCFSKDLGALKQNKKTRLLCSERVFVVPPGIYDRPVIHTESNVYIMVKNGKDANAARHCEQPEQGLA